jgi:urea transport system substrate-binding protein
MRKTQRLFLVVSLVFTLLLLGVPMTFASGKTEGSEGQPIKLGLINMRTGGGSIHAIHVYRAVKLAVDEINAAGGLLGRKVILIEEDSHTEVDLALQKLNKLMKDDKVAATAVFDFSNILQAHIELAAQNRHLLLGGGLNEGAYINHYMVGAFAQPNQWIFPIMDWANKEVGSKAYLIGSDYSWGRGSLESAKKHLAEIGGTIAGEAYYPLGTTDWAPAVQKIKDSGANWILPMVAGNDYVTFLKAFFDFGLQKTITVANTIFNEEDAAAFPPDLRGGLVTVATYFMTVPTAENKTFITNLRKNFGSDVIMTNFGEAYYDQVWMWAKAVTAAGTTETEAVIKALEKLPPFVGPQGRLTIDPKTHCYIMNAYLGRVNTDGTISVEKSLGEVFPVPAIQGDARPIP